MNGTSRQMTESYEEERKIGSISFRELMSKRVYWQPFLIAMFGMFGQQFCGINVVFFYQQTIFEKANSSVDPSEFQYLQFPNINIIPLVERKDVSFILTIFPKNFWNK